MNLSPEDLQRAASDPRTAPALLRDIAVDHPQLRPAVATNPSAYPELLQWLGELGDPQINAALAYRNSFPETGVGANGATYAAGAGAAGAGAAGAGAGAAGAGAGGGAGEWSAHAGHELGGNPDAPWGGGPAAAGGDMAVFNEVIGSHEDDDDHERRGAGVWWFLLVVLLVLIGAFLVWKFILAKDDSTGGASGNSHDPVTSAPQTNDGGEGDQSTGGADGDGQAEGDGVQGEGDGGDGSDGQGEAAASPAEKLSSQLDALGCPAASDAINPFIAFTQEVAGDGPLSAADADAITGALASYGNRCGGESMWEVADQLTHQASAPELANVIASSDAFGVRIEAAGGFVAPSNNIVCHYYSEGPRPVACTIKADANNQEHEYFLENLEDKKTGWNYRYLPPTRELPTQQYGWRDSWRGINCSLETTGVTCVDSGGKGFHLSRADHGYDG